MAYRTYGIWLAAAMVCGCVDPGGVESTTLLRYQEGLARQGPLRRLDEKAPQGLVRPLGEPRVPELAVRKGTEKLLDAKGKLTEKPSTIIDLTMDEAVLRALTNSPEIRIASFDPGIARQDLVRAASAFDPVLFGSVGRDKQDKQQALAFQGVPEQQWRDTYNVGLKQRTVTGAEVEAKYQVERQRTVDPRDSEWEQLVSLTVKQPLLRDAWCDVNLATVRVARINRDISDEAFRDKVEQTVGTVMTGYWNLWQSRRAVTIQQDLLATTEETLRQVRAREQIDATDEHIKQVEAALASRKASLFRAQKGVVDAQDKLARTLDDKRINLVDEYVLSLKSAPADAPLVLNVDDQMETAKRRSPLLSQARMAIRSANISVMVAKNQLLPRLDLAVSGVVQGLGPNIQDSSGGLESLDHIGSNVTLSYEIPLNGNREARSNWEKAKLQKAKAVATLQDLATQIAGVVRERIRLVETAQLDLARQREAIAGYEAQLRAMALATEAKGTMSPERLALMLSAQEALAGARAAEAQAIADYNNALVNLAQVTGTVLTLPGMKIGLPAAAGDAPWPVRK